MQDYLSIKEAHLLTIGYWLDIFFQMDAKIERDKAPNKVIDWHKQAFNYCSEHDQEQIADLRSFLAAYGTGQNWYYPCSGLDITPILIAPSGSKLSYIDLEYDGHDEYREISKKYLQYAFINMFRNTGAEVKKSKSWNKALNDKNQEITIGGDIKVNLTGVNVNEYHPEYPVDVLFENNHVVNDPAEMHKLRAGGLLVFAGILPGIGGLYSRSTLPQERLLQIMEDMEYEVDHFGLDPRLDAFSLADIGLEKIKTFYMEKIYGLPFGKSGIYSTFEDYYFILYHKTRDFTSQDGLIINNATSILYPDRAK